MKLQSESDNEARNNYSPKFGSKCFGSKSKHASRGDDTNYVILIICFTNVPEFWKSVRQEDWHSVHFSRFLRNPWLLNLQQSHYSWL